MKHFPSKNCFKNEILVNILVEANNGELHLIEISKYFYH